MSGDLLVNGGKDIAITASSLQDDVQQVYIRLMTEPGDFAIYPSMGTDLSRLYGMPQSKETGEYGSRLIMTALEKEDVFIGRNIQINAVPVSKNSIRFDVHIITDTNQPVTVSVNQDLGA
jgi:hypothetical protein